MIKYGYFRHRFDSVNNEKIQSLIDEVGIVGYAYYFTLLELYGQRVVLDSPSQLVQIHQRVVSNTWRKRVDSCDKVLTKLQLSGLLVYTKTKNTYSIDIPNFWKYYGSYKKTETHLLRKESKEKESKVNKSKVKESKVNPQTPTPKVQEVFDTWNNHRGKLPMARALTANRKNKITTRLKDFPNIADWVEAVEKVSASDFCNGLNDRGWIADFDFLIKPMSLEKILEGRYDNRKKISKAQERLNKTMNIKNPFENENGNEQNTNF